MPKKKIQRKDSSGLCKNMMCNFGTYKSSVEIRSGTKLNSNVLHLEIRFYCWKNCKYSESFILNDKNRYAILFYKVCEGNILPITFDTCSNKNYIV